MDKKKLIGVLVAAALAVGAYFFGADVVNLVKEQVGEAAPVTSEVAPSEPE